MSPTVRPKVYLNGATIMSTSTADLIAIARRTGYDGIEVRAERLLDAPEEVRECGALVRPGEVWSLNGLQLKTSLEGRLDRELLFSELGPRLEICHALGATYLLVVPPRMNGIDVAPAIEAMKEGLAVVRDRASEIGVRVAFEFLGFGDCPISTPELAAAVVEGLAGVELVLDSCHWHASGGGSLANFPMERLAMVHLNDAPAKAPELIEDADRILPGEGVIALAGLCADLRTGGYRGPFSLETFNPAYWQDDPEQIARQGRAAVARILG